MTAYLVHFIDVLNNWAEQHWGFLVLVVITIWLLRGVGRAAKNTVQDILWGIPTRKNRFKKMQQFATLGSRFSTATLANPRPLTLEQMLDKSSDVQVAQALGMARYNRLGDFQAMMPAGK